MIKSVIGGTLEAIKEEGIESAKSAAGQITGNLARRQAGQKTQAVGQKTQGQAKPVQNQGFGGAVKTAIGISSTDALPSQPIEQTQETKDVVKHLYGGEKPQIPQEKIAQKEIEDKQKEEALKQRLHSEYYHKLTTPPKKEEERPAEKVEKEKKEEEFELQKKEEKKPPPLVQKARERVEKFPGASG